MKIKSLLIVVVLLAVLSAIVYVGQRPGLLVPDDAHLERGLFSNVEIEQATKLRLEDQGKTVTLLRQPDGIWCIASYFDLPADFTKLSAFTGSLTEAKLQRLVTTSTERIARLEFKDTKIVLLGAADKVIQSVTLGKRAEANSGRYVRFGTEQKAYLTDFNAQPSVDQLSWADTRLLDLKPEDISTVDITFSDGSTVALARMKKEAPWTTDRTPVGKRINVGKISSLISSNCSVRYSNIVDPGDANVTAAKAHLRLVKLTTFDGQTYAVALGRKPEDKKLKPVIAQQAPMPAVEKSIVSLADGVTKIPTDTNPGQTKPSTPEYDIIPAGPVIVLISSSDSTAPVNALMKKRAFQIPEYSFTGLPQAPEELFEAIPPEKPELTQPVEPKTNER